MATATQPAMLRVDAQQDRLYRLAPLLALGIYSALLIVGITHHEPWADEAQAWQIVRDLPLSRVLLHQLHYEGHPGLWYLFLSLLQHLGVSYDGMRWAIAPVALASTALLLFRSPFPVWARCGLAFTFFLSFQYAIVARDYSLAPLLFFVLAIVWRRENALLPAFVLGLMANLALHCAAASFGFAAVYGYELWRGKRAATHVWTATALLLGMYLLAALTVAPRPADLSFMQTSVHTDWFIASVGYVLRSVVYALTALGKPWELGLPLLCLFVWSLWRVRDSRYVLPVVAVSVFSGVVFFNFWHLGIFDLTCITSVWMAWPLHFRSRWARIGAAILFAEFLAVQLGWATHAFRYDYSQPYSADRMTANFLRPYVAKRIPMAVTYVNTGSEEPHADETNAESISYFHSVGVYPYFSGPLFLNEPLTYWNWSVNEHTNEDLRAALATRPPLVMAIYYDRRSRAFDPSSDLHRARLRDLTGRGYVLTHWFCGGKPENFKEREHICDLIFELPEEASIRDLHTPY